MLFYIYAVARHPELSVDVLGGMDLVGFMEMLQEDARTKLSRWQQIKYLEHLFMQRYPEPKMSDHNEKWDKIFYNFYCMNTRALYEAYVELDGKKYDYFLPNGRYSVGQILPAIPMDAIAVHVK